MKDKRITKRTVAKVLRMAAKALEEKGWCRGTYSGLGGSMCALGAIRYCTSEFLGLDCGVDTPSAFGHSSSIWSYLKSEAAYQVSQVLGADCLLTWNDKVAPDGQTIIKAMRKAAKALDHGGKLSPYVKQMRFTYDPPFSGSSAAQ